MPVINAEPDAVVCQPLGNTICVWNEGASCLVCVPMHKLLIRMQSTAETFVHVTGSMVGFARLAHVSRVLAGAPGGIIQKSTLMLKG